MGCVAAVNETGTDPNMHLIRIALASLLACGGAAQAQISGDVVKIGIITDMSSVYADIDGAGELHGRVQRHLGGGAAGGHHIGAPVGKLAHAGRARTHAGEVDDTIAGQRPAAGGVCSHGCILVFSFVDLKKCGRYPI